MRVRGLDGNEYSWILAKYVGNIHFNCSDIHESTRKFLTNRYPAAGQILEEVYIPGEKLYLDFFLPVKSLAVECQGIQHEKHNTLFHPTKLDFYKAKANDRRKKEWCELNGIILLYFFPKETVEEWEKKLTQ